MSAPSRGGPAALPVPPPDRTGWPWIQTPIEIPAMPAGGWPKISIVTPSFQQAPYLEECLRSVLLQGYPNLEFIVIDGGSTDGSVEIIRRYEAHLTYWHSSRDRGQGNAINLGFARATGEIVAWLNSDDFYLPGALHAVAREFRRSEPDLVYGDAWNLYEEDQSLRYWQAYWIRPEFLCFGGMISTHAAFWRKAIHVPLWEELDCNIDGELWQRLVPNRRLRYLPRPLGVFRAQPESKSSAERWRSRWASDDVKIWSRHGRPSRNRLLLQWYAKSQRVFKWFTWRRRRNEKRGVLDACAWPPLQWRGPRP